MDLGSVVVARPAKRPPSCVPCGSDGATWVFPEGSKGKKRKSAGAGCPRPCLVVLSPVVRAELGHAAEPAASACFLLHVVAVASAAAAADVRAVTAAHGRGACSHNPRDLGVLFQDCRGHPGAEASKTTGSRGHDGWIGRRASLMPTGPTGQSMGILTTILIILLIIFLLGAIPVGRRNRGYGIGLGGIATVILIVLLVLWLT